MTTIDDAKAKESAEELIAYLSEAKALHDAGIVAIATVLAAERSAVWQLERLRADYDALKGRLEEAGRLARDAWGALNFILAFYEPDQNYLDTNAWKQAEAGGRRVHAALAAFLDREKEAGRG